MRTTRPGACPGDQVRIECDAGPRHLTIVECRPPWREDAGPEWTRFPIAWLRYTQATRTWSLYRRDRNLRFHLYNQLPPSPRVDDLLHERSTATLRRSSGDRSGLAEAFGQFQYLTALLKVAVESLRQVVLGDGFTRLTIWSSSPR